ncbi:hypothetical protein [Escherichia phage dw-ec]|nr:hypothetical protein [Escherichia phage BI-EHEC]UJQ43799.1 hypothetical protein [Escherichia phage dw-ec]
MRFGLRINVSPSVTFFLFMCINAVIIVSH